MTRAVMAAALVLVIAADACAWGPSGHAAAAMVAERRLSPTARAIVAQLLGGRTMASVSSWADDVKDSTRPETYDWHFVNIPLKSDGYDAKRDCASRGQGECILNVLPRLEHVLADPSTSPQKRAEALMFIVHLVADLQQPLHASKDYVGGTRFRIETINGATNLHEAWDGALLHTTHRNAADLAAAAEAWLRGRNEAAIAGGSYVDWATESFTLAKTVVYPQVLDDHRIDPGEREAAIRLIDERIAEAGVRLAAVVNRDLALVSSAQPRVAPRLRIVLVRHAETTWNHDHRLEGWSDPPLSDTGRRQAQRVAERLRTETFDAVYSSTLQRSIETARIIAPQAAITMLSDLRERNFGAFEGAPESDPEYLRRVGLRGDALGNGETHAQFDARVQRALDAIRAQHPVGEVLIVGHNGTNHLLMRYLLHLAPEASEKIEERPEDVYAIDIAAKTPPLLVKLP